MSTAKCPRCADLVTLPETNHPHVRVQCPLCLEKFELGELLERLPPPLIVVELPEGVTLGSSRALPVAAPIAAMSLAPADTDELDFAENIVLEPEGYTSSLHKPLDKPLEEDTLPGAAWSIAENGEPTLVPSSDEAYDLKTSQEDRPFNFGAPIGGSGVASASISAATVASPNLKGRIRPKRKERNAIVEIIKMGMGGVIGIAGAFVLLWWLPGTWGRDLADVGKKLSVYPAVRWAIPEKFWDKSVARAPATAQESNLPDAGKKKEPAKKENVSSAPGVGPKNSSPPVIPGNDPASLQGMQEKAKPPVIDNPGGLDSGFGAADPLAVDPNALPPEEMPAEATTPEADPAVMPEEDPQPIAPEQDPVVDPVVEPATDPATEPVVDPAAEPKAEPTTEPAADPASDPLPVDPAADKTEVNKPLVPAEEPAVEPMPTEEPVLPASADAAAIAKLSEQITVADTALKGYFVATEAKDNSARGKSFRELYAALSEAGVLLSNLDPQSADVTAVTPNLQTTLSTIPATAPITKVLNTMANKALEEPAADKGIALRGTVKSFRAAGTLFESTVEVIGGAEVLVVTATNPQDQVAVGDTVQVVARMILEPAKNLAGYQGSAPLVLRSNHWQKMEVAK